MEQLNVLELYSGIGGMHYALKASKINAKVIGAVDINPHANAVYKNNFKDTQVLQKTIEGIKIEEYDKMQFDMILMSPPCQPFTRQGKQNGSLDARSQSFMSLIQIIPQLKKKPKYILMENVKGFDESTAHEDFVNMLESLNYSYQEFLLSPIQFGIPNSRLRYFLIAKLESNAKPNNLKQILQVIPEFAYEWIPEIFNELMKNKPATMENSESNVTNLATNEDKNFVIVESTKLNDSYKQCCQSESLFMFETNVKQLNQFLMPQFNNDEKLKLTNELFTKSISYADVVTPNATRTSCFTKNYGRYMEGTGSILLMNDPPIVDSQNEASNEPKKIQIFQNDLRYLSPREISNLHCFPPDFEFLNELTNIQRWRLIGNSLNVLIVSVLIKLLTNNSEKK